jgi:hypothetical protein
VKQEAKKCVRARDWLIFMASKLWRTFNILDVNLLKAYLQGLGLYFWPFQRPFEAVLRHSGFLNLEPEFLCTFFLACLKFKKWGNFERIIYLKGSF